MGTREPFSIMRRHLDAQIRRRGRRPAIIGLWAVLSFAMGAEAQIQWLFRPIDGLVMLHQQIPPWILTALWFAAGGFALRGALTRKDKDVADGFFSLAFMPGAYAGSYVWAGITAPDWHPIFYGLLVFGIISLIVYTAATDERPKPGDPDYDCPPVS